MNETKVTSSELWQRALNILPGGVNSPVRAFGSVGRDPIFMESGKGAYLVDRDGKKYVDCIGSWGPMILGHAHPDVEKALLQAVRKGTSFGAATEGEVLFAEELQIAWPSLEMLRLVNSGTEATMSALRLARGFTGRDVVVKFKGCYHGHGDSFLIEAGSGALTHGIPSSDGVTSATATDTWLANYNDLGSVKELFEKGADKIAAVIVEAVAGNMGVVPPVEGFLEGLRNLCDNSGAILIFDEVMSGFRAGPHGAQGRYHVKPDLTTFGKVIGAGLPVGAYGGKKEIMQKVSPLGPVYQAGTLSGNPLAVAAGRAQLKVLTENPHLFDELDSTTEKLAQELVLIGKEAGIPVSENHVGSMYTLFFSEEKVKSYDQALACDTELFAKYFSGMLERGIYLAPSQFESLFVSAETNSLVTEQILNAARETLFSL